MFPCPPRVPGCEFSGQIRQPGDSSARFLLLLIHLTPGDCHLTKTPETTVRIRADLPASGPGKEVWESPVSRGLRTWPSALQQGALAFLQCQAEVCSAHSFPCQREKVRFPAVLLTGVRPGRGKLGPTACGLRAGSARRSGASSGELDLNFERDNETVGCFRAIP